MSFTLVVKLEIIHSIAATNEARQNVDALPVHSTPITSENPIPIRLLLVEDYAYNSMLVRSYLKNTPCQIDEAADFDKAIGGGFGFIAITDIGKSLEASSKNNNRSDIEKWLNELSHYLEKVEVVYV